MHYDRLLETGEIGPAKSAVIENGGPCRTAGCADTAVKSGYCNMHHKRVLRHGADGGPQRLRMRVGTGIDYKGYRHVRVNGRSHIEHRLVMARHLGRPLLVNENVHHIDGDRLNNDLSNLELWVKTQPCGQRATDKVKAALRLLKDYPELAAQEGFRLIALESQEATDLLGGRNFNWFRGDLTSALQEH